MQSSAFHRTGVGLLILAIPFLMTSLAGCGAVDSELNFTLGACDILNCDTLFFLGLNDDHDDMSMEEDHDDMSMEDDHDAMNDDEAEEEEHDDAIEGDDGSGPGVARS